MITKNDPLEDLKNYILGLNIGKLTLAEIETIKQYMAKLGIDKETIDKLFAEIINDINTIPFSWHDKELIEYDYQIEEKLNQSEIYNKTPEQIANELQKN